MTDTMSMLSVDLVDADSEEVLATWTIEDGCIPQRGDGVVLSDPTRPFRVADVIHHETKVILYIRAVGTV